MNERLTVAVTGASGTVGREVVRLLEDDERVGRIIATARLPRDPAQLGWQRTTLQTADVREADAVAQVLRGADVVVHCAFAIYGGRRNETDLRAINIGGSLNVARAAAVEGARRFVYLSSVAAYGLLPDNPQPLSEDDPVRTTPHHFYAAQKAEVEPQVRSLLEEAGVESYVLRPCGIVGPHAAGAALDLVPDRVVRGGRGLLRLARRIGVRPPAVAPVVALQFVHAEDVARAVLLAVHGDGRPGVYNLAGSDVIEGEEATRLLGLAPLPLPRELRRSAMRATAHLQGLWPAFAWPLAFAEPALVSTDRARRDLGWNPRYSSREALQATRAGLGL